MLRIRTCTVVVGIEHGKQSANGKDVVILMEHHVGRGVSGQLKQVARQIFKWLNGD